MILLKNPSVFLRWLLPSFFLCYLFLSSPAYAERLLISLAGPTGSGKSTQGLQLSRILKLAHISPGMILRESIARGDEEGLLCQEYMERGEFVPDEVITALMEREMNSEHCAEGCVLDGYPRTLHLWEQFVEQATDPCRILLIYLELSEDMAVARCQARRYCSTCAQGCPSNAQELCPRCAQPLLRRDVDADLGLLRTRIAMEFAELQPVLEAAEQDGCLFRVSAEQEPADCLHSILQILESAEVYP